MTVILIIIIILGLLAIYYISIYNKLQYYKTKIEKVEGLIDQDLRDKFDTIMEADIIIKSKKDYLKEYKNLKEQKISNFELERKLKEAENIIRNLYEDNSELNQNEKMTEIIHNIKFTNEKITAGISYYNNHTSKLNDFIRKFPNNIIAKIHHTKTKPFFDGKDMNDDDILDFKL